MGLPWLLFFCTVYAVGATSDPNEDDPNILHAYDCNKPVSSERYSLLEVGSCKRPDSLYTHTNRSAQILQTRQWDQTDVFACDIFVTFTITQCTFNHHTALVRSYNRVIPLTREQCKRIHDTQEYVFYQQIIPVKINAVTHADRIIVGSRDKQGYCHKGANPFHDIVTNVVYEDAIVDAKLRIKVQHYKAKLDLVKNQIILRSNVLCDFSDGECQDVEQGNSFWSPSPPPTSCSRYGYNVLHDGPVTHLTLRNGNGTTDDYLVANIGSRLFAFKLQDSFKDCGGLIYHHTEFPAITVIFDIAYYHTDNNSQATPELSSFYLSKLMFLEITHTNNYNNLLADSIYKRCLLEQQLIRTKLSLLQAFPESAGHLLFNRPSGKHALTLGETVLVYTCERVVVEIKKNSTECYSSLPVIYNGVTKYLSPVTRVLQNFAELQACSRLAPVYFKIRGDTWIKLTPTIEIVEKPPKILNPTEPITLGLSKYRHISASGLFNLEDVRQFEQQLHYQNSRQTLASHLAKGLVDRDISQNGRISLYGLLNQEDLAKIAKNTFYAIYGWISNIGSFFSAIVGTALIFQIFKYIISTFLRCFHLQQEFGFSCLICAGLWSTLSQFLLIQKDIFMGTRRPNNRRTVDLRALENGEVIALQETSLSQGITASTAEPHHSRSLSAPLASPPPAIHPPSHVYPDLTLDPSAPRQPVTHGHHNEVRVTQSHVTTLPSPSFIRRN